MPVAITNAFNTPPGLPEYQSLWGKIARSFRAAFLRRSEDRDGSDSIATSDQIADQILLKMKNKIKASKLWQQFKERNGKQKEKKERLLPARIVDFLRLKRHRTADSPSIAAIVSDKPAKDDKIEESKE